MSVSQVPLRPLKRGSLAKLWFGIALIVGAALLLAWLGAGQFKALSVETVAPGTGAPLTNLDGALIEYTGTTEDGTVFDTTEGRGPAPFLVAQTVPGFSQALQRMQEGGRYKVVIPGRLAYGPNPPEGSGLEPNADLYFDVHVLQVARNVALMQQQMQQQMEAQGAQGPQGGPGAGPPGDVPQSER